MAKRKTMDDVILLKKGLLIVLFRRVETWENSLLLPSGFVVVVLY